MADARSYTEKRYRFCDNRIRKKITETQIILNHLNNNIFEFRKKTRFYRAQRCQNPKKKVLGCRLIPSGQLQQDPMADARSYTTETEILNHLNTDIFEFSEELDFIGPNGVRIRKNEF